MGELLRLLAAALRAANTFAANDTRPSNDTRHRHHPRAAGYPARSAAR